MIWEPTSRVYLKQAFNLTQATEIAKDLVSDAQNFSKRVNDSGHLEELDVRHFVAKFTALNVNLNQVIQLEGVSQGNIGSPHLRVRRNIFGSILSSLTGLVTEEEMQKQKVEEKQLELKVKNIITHETHVEQELIKLQNEMTKLYYEDFKQIRKLEFTIVHNMRYVSRKNWRMRILNEYMEKMKLAVDLAYGGSIGMSSSADLMAAVQIKGSSPIQYQGIEHDDDHFYVKMYFDVGTYTTVDRNYRNDTTSLILTNSKTYIVSEHFLIGSPLSIAEVRVIGALGDNCLVIVHLTHYSYKAVNSGNITCVIYGKGKRTFQLKVGEMLHIEPRDYCRNSCVDVGYRGYVNKNKNLPPQPTVQPSALQHFFQEIDTENVPSPLLAGERAHQVSHDMFNNDIRENEIMLEQLNAAQDDDTYVTVGSYMGYVGGGISVIVCCVICALCVKCKSKKNSTPTVNIQMKRFKELSTGEDPEEEEQL